MIDPVEAHLWFLLTERSLVHTEDVCWWDAVWACEVLRRAGMREEATDVWRHGPETAAWFTYLWDAMRRQHAASQRTAEVGCATVKPGKLAAPLRRVFQRPR